MIKKYLEFMLESVEGVSPKIDYYKPTNLIQELCVCMLLINNDFLDKILDLGLKSRYTENSHIFLTDLKNLLFGRNRLKLGKFLNDKCVEDDEPSKINTLFNSVEFDIEKDWNKLVNSRIISRNIIDKLIPGEKIEEDRISNIFWLGPNKTEDHKEDIVIEMADDVQYSIYLNRNLTLTKTASFSTFADDLIGAEVDKLYSEEYIPKWNKLAQQWVRTIYDNANKNIQIHIEKFIDEDRIDSIGWFNYFEIKHKDPRFKRLGEYIKEFDKNIINLSDLLKEVWKNRDICFIDVETVYNQWEETKIFILNSKILEHIFTESLVKNNIQDIRKLDDGYKLATGKIKMKLVKTLVEKLGCSEKPLYYMGNNGNIFHMMPSKDFFRSKYEDFTLKFDYHVKMVIEEEEENNDFNVKVKLEMDDKPLINFDVIIKFSGGDISSKLSAKYKFELSDDFNYRVSEKLIDNNEKPKDI